jgi:hypothetical protein
MAIAWHSADHVEVGAEATIECHGSGMGSEREAPWRLFGKSLVSKPLLFPMTGVVAGMRSADRSEQAWQGNGRMEPRLEPRLGPKNDPRTPWRSGSKGSG